MKKIISFSLWGNKTKYINGALLNIPLQKEFYPGWVCRFYIDETVPQEFVIQAIENGCEVELMEPKSDGNFGLFWRFEPFKDLSIERFIVRDTDSRLNPREADAVKEWEESGEEFHIMRDHKYHAAPICGGMFGATNVFIKKIEPEYDVLLNSYLKSLSFNELYKQRGKYFNTDQPFLWKYIWPRIINSHIAHIKADGMGLNFTNKERIFKKENPDGMFVGKDMEI